MPAGAKTDLPLPKPKPISNCGNNSVITYLRRGRKKLQWDSSWEKGVRRCERNNSADTKVREEGGERRCSRHWSRKSSLATHAEDHGEAGCPSAVHGGPQWSRLTPAAHGRDPTPEEVDAWRRLWHQWEVYARSGSCQDLWTHGERQAHAGAGLLAELVTQWGTHAGTACSWRTAPCGKDSCWSSLWRSVSCGRDPMLEEVENWG